jgi:lipoate-protein ligase B
MWRCRLGLTPYKEALSLQRRLLRLRQQGLIDDVLLTLEHPPTVTLGRFGKEQNLLLIPEELKKRGIAFCHSDRGGDATFHCPGQLVAYPIMDIRSRGGRLRGYLNKLEETAILTLASYGISAHRWPEHPGLWVGQDDGAFNPDNSRQIGALGLRVSRGVAIHGLSLNVNPDLSQFSVINLCGLPGMTPTSMADLTGLEVDMDGVRQRFEDNFAAVFGVTLEDISAEQVKQDSMVAAEA